MAQMADASDETLIRTLIRWTDELSNLSSIDAQHKKLVVYINAVHRAARNSDMAAVLEVFGQPKAYTEQRFGYEERLFDLRGNPEGAQHKDVHHRFAQRVLEWEKQAAGGNPTVVMEILRGLVDWLVSHTMKVDKRYEAFTRERGVERAGWPVAGEMGAREAPGKHAAGRRVVRNTAQRYAEGGPACGAAFRVWRTVR